MSNESQDGLIKEGDQVVVRRDKNLKVVPVRRNCKLWIERSKFFLDSAIGFPYGTSFEVVDQKLVKSQNVDVGGDFDLDVDEDDEGKKDNRNLTDTSENQKLSSDEIRSMRKDGMHGEDIIEQLIQNSATFTQKNDFAKQKYIKKKKKKYVPVITVLKPTARLLLEMYYNKGPNRICNLRVDSLAQVLTYANVRAGNKMLVVESCVGLVVGAVMERMGGRGTVIQLYSGLAPVQQVVESFDFPKEHHKNLYSFPLSMVNALKKPGNKEELQATKESSSSPEAVQGDSEHQCSGNDRIACSGVEDEAMDTVSDGEDDTSADPETQESNSKGVKRKHGDSNHEEREKRWQVKQKQIQEVGAQIEMGDSDGLVVVTKYHPTPIVMHLIDFVASSRPIAVFCQYKEPLMDCFVHLRDRGGVVMLKLTETWLRGYQVLPNRTHPKIKMSSSGGYLLTGTTVKLDNT